MIETYSCRAISSGTPRRTGLAVSPEPRTRWTFCAWSSGTAAPLSGKSVCATDHLDGVVFGRAPCRIDGREERNEDRGDERQVILAGMFAHQQPFGADQSFE